MKKDIGFLLRVDPVLCDGFGHCHELAPDLIDIDEWGYPIIRPGVTPLHDRSALTSARYALRGCPRQALAIDRVKG
jgi:ferredoxin